MIVGQRRPPRLRLAFELLLDPALFRRYPGARRSSSNLFGRGI